MTEGVIVMRDFKRSMYQKILTKVVLRQYVCIRSAYKGKLRQIMY